MFAHEMAEYRRALEKTGPVFCDRGLPDLIGYLRLEGLPVPPNIDAAARDCRYHHRVFLAPYWDAIYATDSERRQTPEVAEQTTAMMARTYPEYGYELIELPRAPVAGRVAFIRASLSI